MPRKCQPLPKNCWGQPFHRKERKVLDILPDRKAATIQDYLKGFPNREDVAYFVMDINRACRDIAQPSSPRQKSSSTGFTSSATAYGPLGCPQARAEAIFRLRSVNRPSGYQTTAKIPTSWEEFVRLRRHGTRSRNECRQAGRHVHANALPVYRREVANMKGSPEW